MLLVLLLERLLYRLLARMTGRLGLLQRAVAGLVALGLAAALSARAEAPGTHAVVERVRMPAWLVHGERRTPLAAGMTLDHDDVIETGADARVWLHTDGAATVRIGADARVRVAPTHSSAAVPPGAAGTAESPVPTSFETLKGALRWTSGPQPATVAPAPGAPRLAPPVPNTPFGLRFADVTATGSHADLWGSAVDGAVVLCLFEGRAEVRAPEIVTAPLSEPLTCYSHSAGAVQASVRPTGLGQLASWAKETDLPAGSGFQQAGGTWSVELATAPSERDALSLYGELRTLGYATQIFPVGPVGQRSYAVRIVNLPSEAEAQALINHLPVPELLSPRILH